MRVSVLDSQTGNKRDRICVCARACVQVCLCTPAYPVLTCLCCGILNTIVATVKMHHICIRVYIYPSRIVYRHYAP